MKNISYSLVNLSERKFILLVTLSSFLMKVIFAYIFISQPEIPHDFYAYIDSANLLLSGKPLYQIPISNEKICIYPPLFPTLMAGWIAIFGTDYFLLKFPSIIFSSLTIIPFFYLLKKVSSLAGAKYLTLIFSFSYIVLFSSGFLGNDDDVFMFFMVTSVYLFLSQRYKLSALSLGISTLFKPIPIILFPAIIIYLYKISGGIRQVIKYIFVFTITLLVLLFPFYLNSGISVLYPYIGAVNFRSHMPTVAFLSPLNLIRTGIGICQNAIHYLSTHTMISYDQNPLKATVICPLNVFFNKIATPYTLLGVVLIIIYIFKFRIKDEKLEFIRNCFFLILGGILFSKAFVPLYFLWFLPFFLLLLSFKEKEKIKSCILSKYEIFGILLVFISLLTYAVNSIHYSFQTQGRFFLLLCCFWVGMGTYLMFLRTPFKKIWSFIVFLSLLYENIVIGPLLLLIFKPVLVKFIPDIPLGPFETSLSYAMRFTIEFVIMFIVIIVLVRFMREIHTYLKDDYGGIKEAKFGN